MQNAGRRVNNEGHPQEDSWEMKRILGTECAANPVRVWKGACLHSVHFLRLRGRLSLKTNISKLGNFNTSSF